MRVVWLPCCWIYCRWLSYDNRKSTYSPDYERPKHKNFDDSLRYLQYGYFDGGKIYRWVPGII
jgi:hypothetical protein